MTAAVIGLLISSACSSCRRPAAELTESAYREVVTAFYTGLAAMETTQEVLAREKFDRVVTLAPQEPAGWANVGLLLMRQQEIEPAKERLTKAAELAPRSAEIQKLLALLESRAGNIEAAARHWKRALELKPEDGRAAFALARDLERLGGAEHDAEAQRVLDALVSRPDRDNLAARLEFARLAAKRGDASALARAIAPLAKSSASWPPQAQAQLQSLRETAGDPRAAATRVAFIKNFLVREPEYRRAMSELTTPLEAVGEPIERFFVLKNPEPQPAAADTAMTFTLEDLPRSAGGEASKAGAASAAAASPAVSATSPASASASASVTSTVPQHAVAADLNYDFRLDAVHADSSGVRILHQEADGRMTDVTAATKLPAIVLRAPALGAWAADIDVDGDLDIVVASVGQPAPVVLRNNGDGTFAVITPFSASGAELRGFAWADFDGEGVPDAAFLQADGSVRLFINLRGGAFREQALPPTLGKAVAIAAAEATGDALIDLIALAADGSVASVSNGATVAALARVSDPPQGLTPGVARLIVADLDNNAAPDLIVAGPSATRVMLGGPGRTFTSLAASIPFAASVAADVDDDGRLELIAAETLTLSSPGGKSTAASTSASAPGALKIARSRGTKAYHWLRLMPRAATATGDQRINSFGIGGEVEVRAGLHVQKQIITSSAVLIGLGEAAQADVVRIIWPNGILQSEFEKRADATVKADQRLKGSCPWLFAWNGREMSFVTDLIWRSPLGLRINAQATADVLMTEDWVKVRGDQLRPREGAYDLRITADLWETHFFDLVSLMVVDHPEGTEVFVDERFAVPAPALDVRVTGPVRPFAAAHADTGSGADVSAIVRDRDDRHLDFAGRGAYQGITRDHAVELTLPDDAPRSGPLWLIGQGWVHPTDSSINVALGQGSHAPPRGLTLEVADEHGRFRQVRAGLGFPAGKDKTVLIDLTDVFPQGASTKGASPRRLRLSTNLEIFWDRLGWAEGRPDVKVTPRRLALSSAELRYRGFSTTDQKDASTPERPRYQIAGAAPRWRDLEGYHTRFGDVRELLERVDDRYVIMNAGDELALRFPEALTPPAASGLIRDFVMIGDGWVKDGDYNTAFSRAVLPLPTHRSGRYEGPVGRLEDDPVFRAHPRDFEVYHTRYVSPDRARDALRPAAERSVK